MYKKNVALVELTAKKQIRFSLKDFSSFFSIDEYEKGKGASIAYL